MSAPKKKPDRSIVHDGPIDYVFDSSAKTPLADVAAPTLRNATFDYCVTNALRRKPTLIVIDGGRDGTRRRPRLH